MPGLFVGFSAASYPSDGFAVALPIGLDAKRQQKLENLHLANAAHPSTRTPAARQISNFSSRSQPPQLSLQPGTAPPAATLALAKRHITCAARE
jgi:hypothetical protein